MLERGGGGACAAPCRAAAVGQSVRSVRTSGSRTESRPSLRFTPLDPITAVASGHAGTYLDSCPTGPGFYRLDYSELFVLGPLDHRLLLGAAGSDGGPESDSVSASAH